MAPKALKQPRQPFFSRPSTVLTVLGLMVIAAVYLWITQPSVLPLPSFIERENTGSYEKTAQLKQKNDENIVAKVSRIIQVSPEPPQIYTVSDVEVFRAQNPAYQNAEQGDRVLIWADQTIVYSPSKNKIIAVVSTESGYSGPVADLPAEEVTEEATVEIRNGSGVAGAAARMRNALIEQEITVLRIGDAAIRRTGTIVVDLTDGNAPKALEAAISASSGTIASMPLGEPASDASILIIIGQ